MFKNETSGFLLHLEDHCRISTSLEQIIKILPPSYSSYRRCVKMWLYVLHYFTSFLARAWRSWPPLAETSSYFVCLRILLFIICWLAAGIWSSIAYECRLTITAVAIFRWWWECDDELQNEKDNVSCTGTKALHAYWVVKSYMLLAAHGSKAKSRGKGGGYSNTYIVL